MNITNIDRRLAEIEAKLDQIDREVPVERKPLDQMTGHELIAEFREIVRRPCPPDNRTRAERLRDAALTEEFRRMTPEERMAEYLRMIGPYAARSEYDPDPEVAKQQWRERTGWKSPDA